MKTFYNLKWWCWLILIALFTVGGYFLINEAYKDNQGFVTVWGGADVLSYYGSCLAFIGTVLVSIIALHQNKRFTETQIKAECYSRLQLQHIEFLKISYNPKINVCINVFSERFSKEKPSSKDINLNEQKTIILIFDSIGKALPFGIKVRYIKLIEIDKEEEKSSITFHPHDKNFVGNLCSVEYKSNGLRFGVLINLNLMLEEAENCYKAEKIIIHLDLEYINGFNVQTNGKYIAECHKINKKDDSGPVEVLYECDTFACSEESYSIE